MHLAQNKHPSARAIAPKMRIHTPKAERLTYVLTGERHPPDQAERKANVGEVMARKLAEGRNEQEQAASTTVGAHGSALRMRRWPRGQFEEVGRLSVGTRLGLNSGICVPTIGGS
jgi:hypothetical protein